MTMIKSITVKLFNPKHRFIEAHMKLVVFEVASINRPILPGLFSFSISTDKRQIKINKIIT
jgi:hypothetical protein